MVVLKRKGGFSHKVKDREQRRCLQPDSPGQKLAAEAQSHSHASISFSKAREKWGSQQTESPTKLFGINAKKISRRSESQEMGWQNLDIDAGLGGGEETQRFGPRNEKGSSLYQVDTLACISPKGDEELIGCPSISSIAGQFGVCLVIANNVLIFDEACNAYKVSFSFASNVDCIAWHADGNFIAIGESSGVLSLAHVPSKKIILSQSLLSKEQSLQFRTLVFCESERGLFELEILPSKGSLTKLTNIDLRRLGQAISEGNMAEMKEIHDQLSREVTDITFIHSESLNHIVEYESDVQRKLLISGQGEYGLSVWEKEKDGKLSAVNFASDYFNEDIGFLKCLFSPNGEFFIALDTEYHISLWSTSLLTPLIYYEDVKVQDFTLFSTNSVEEDSKKNGSSEEIKLVILTKAENKKSLLQVHSLPNFEHVYTLQVSGCSRLAAVESQLDAIYFIEGVEDDLKNDSMFDDDENNNDDMDIVTIRLRCLTEALPSSRFMRLLQKQKFDQAEEFAKQFNLDVELVYCVKASAILDKLEPWGKSVPKTVEDYEKAIAELKACLNEISDTSQIITCCLAAALPTFHATFDLLKYAKERLDSKEGAWSSTPNVQLLLDGLNRLVTFEVAFGAKNFSVATWKPFRDASLLDEVISCFDSDVAAAIVIWRRHQPELEPGFTLDNLRIFLASIPDSIPSTKIIQWLREDFVPFVFTKLPEGQMVLARWLDTRARHMEISEKENWPYNALELAEVMFKAFSDVAKTTYGRGNATPAQFAMQVCKLSIPCSNQKKDSKVIDEDSLAGAMAKLADLVTCLREISVLHSQFACKLSLHCYQKESTKTIAFRLLDRVLAPELIPSTVESYVKPYAAKHNLIADDLLLAYVDDLTERRPGLAGSIWYSKITAIVECITDQELKCKATLRVMSSAAVPWCSDVQQLVDSVMKSNPNNESLKQQYQFAELKATMMQYGIRNYVNQDPVIGLGTIHYIFSCDTETALEDAMQVVRTYQIEECDAYFFRIKSWIVNDKVEESCHLLRTLNVQLSVQIADKVIDWAISSVEDPPLDEEDKEYCLKRLKAAVEIIRIVSALDSAFKDNRKSMLQALRSIMALQVEFKTFVSFEEYNDQEKKDEIWRNFLMNAEEDPKKSKVKLTAVSKTKVMRLADLLGFDQITRQKQEISVYLSEGNIIQVLRVIRDTRNGIPTRNHLTMYKDTLFHLLTEKWHSSQDKDVQQWLSYIDNVYRLSAFGTGLCNEDDLRDFLEITKLLRLATSVSEQCESADYRQDAARQTDTFAKWNLTDRYEDDGMVLYSPDVIPLLKRYYKACFRENHHHVRFETHHISGGYTTGQAMQELGAANQSIIKVLLENSLQVLALQYFLQALGTMFQNINSTDAGFKVPEQFAKEVHTNKELFTKMLPVAAKGSLEIIHNLFKKVLTHRHIDHDLALGYLCSLPSESALQTMASLKDQFGNKYRRIQAAALIGVDYAGLRADNKLLTTFQQLQDCAYWGKKFAFLKISFKDVYKLIHLTVEEKKALLERLVSNPHVDIEILLKFCKTFSCDEDEALLMYIKTLLLPHHGSKEDLGYKSKVLKAIDHVKLNDMLYSTLHSCLTLISPYDYDRLSLVLNNMEKLKPGSVNVMVTLLEHLSCYDRCASPSEYEFSYASHTEDEQLLLGSANILPEISKTRLPFHPLIGESPWKILSPELKSEAVVRKIESITKCIKVDPDKMYTAAINNIVNNSLQLEEKDDSAAKKEGKQFKFETIQGLLASVSNAHMAIAAAKWVAKLLPTGEEKVKALKACVDLCINLEKKCSESELATVRGWTKRFGELCRRIEIEAVLVKYGILDEEYRNLTLQPASLICKLYEDFGCKAEIVSGRVVGIPNIHKIADEIAKISATNVSKIHVYLMEKWLPNSKKAGSQDGDTTMMDISVIPDESDSQDDENNLKRVIYILNNNTQEKNALCLTQFAFKEESSTVTHTCRIRALQALFTLVSLEVIEATSGMGKSLDEIRVYLTSLLYLTELESLHMPQTMPAFTRCNKEGLVKGLWRNHSHEPKGVRLIADLCFDYKIYDVQLWNILLPQFLQFGMMDYLRHALVVSSGVPELREIPCLAKMWRSVILAPFSSVATPLSEDEEIACLESANLLQRCPVILDLNMQDIANRYHKIGMYTQAVSCLTLIPEVIIRDRCLKKLLEDVGCLTILDQVEKERKRGRFDGHLDHVQEEVFSYINKNKLYKEILKSAYFQKFVNYLVNSNQLNDLLMQTIISGRINNAIQLVELCDKTKSSKTLAKREKAQELHGIQRLFFYLQSNNLFEQAIAYLPDFEPEEDAYSVQM